MNTDGVRKLLKDMPTGIQIKSISLLSGRTSRVTTRFSGLNKENRRRSRKDEGNGKANAQDCCGTLEADPGHKQSKLMQGSILQGGKNAAFSLLSGRTSRVTTRFSGLNNGKVAQWLASLTKTKTKDMIKPLKY